MLENAINIKKYEYLQIDDVRSVLKIFENMDLSANNLEVSEWAEKNRVLPKELTPMPGRWNNKRFPYLVEIMDCFSKYSEVEKVVFMKGSQIGATTGILENILGYTIDYNPSAMMYVTSTDKASAASIDLRVDRLIHSAGMKDKIFSQVKKKHNKNTGDTRSKKEFAGGYLLSGGANSVDFLQSVSINILLLDEIDRYKDELKGHGSPITLAEARTNVFSKTRKILYISTPTLKSHSKIEELFLKGDQRYYYVPCPECNHFQKLEFVNLIWEVDDNNRLVEDSVYYRCEKCHAKIKNYQKDYMLPNGRWQVTSQELVNDLRSYHLSALYSPNGVFSWEKLAQEYLFAKSDYSKMRAFYNGFLGESWDDRGKAPEYEKLMLKNRRNYQLEVVPEGTLLLTLGVDVQEDRLELELVAWLKNKVSYSLAYKVFNCENIGGTLNDNFNPRNLAWQELEKYILKSFYNQDRSKEYKIDITLIDAGFATNSVYEFCKRFLYGVYPIKGVNYLKNYQTFIDMSSKYYDTKKLDIKRFDISTDVLKDELYSYLKRDLDDIGEIPVGYCFFPYQYDEKYFRMLTSEEKKEIINKTTGQVKYTYHLPYKTRNEALDTRVYNLAAIYIWKYLTGTAHLTWQDFWENLAKFRGQ
ncbi:MAG: phage terminase large subunit family protein [Elusimicrobiota bacterium]|jgi:phage terminase large subunit GpA-like protein|nr:phage terminase large subunit family protein [Elusimicrobiota bacterium]